MATIKLICAAFWGASIFLGALLSADAVGLARHVAHDSDGPATLLVLLIAMTAVFSAFFVIMQQWTDGDFEG